MEEEIDLEEFDESDDPQVLELQRLRLAILENNRRLDEINNHSQGIKWACRSVALLLAVIVFFGAKITFNF